MKKTVLKYAALVPFGIALGAAARCIVFDAGGNDAPVPAPAVACDRTHGADAGECLGSEKPAAPVRALRLQRK